LRVGYSVLYVLYNRGWRRVGGRASFFAYVRIEAGEYSDDALPHDRKVEKMETVDVTGWMDGWMAWSCTGLEDLYMDLFGENK